jgi:hypothetical protein
MWATRALVGVLLYGAGGQTMAAIDRSHMVRVERIRAVPLLEHL